MKWSGTSALENKQLPKTSNKKDNYSFSSEDSQSPLAQPSRSTGTDKSKKSRISKRTEKSKRSRRKESYSSEDSPRISPQSPPAHLSKHIHKSKTPKRKKQENSNYDFLKTKSQEITVKKTKKNTEEFKITKPENSCACFWHITFKIGSVFCYLFLSLFTDDDIVVFISVLFCIVFDFWVTKNLTGRYLVGLRWWSFINDDNETEWVYESKKYDLVIDKTDYVIFWYGQYMISCFWPIMTVIKLIGLDAFWGQLCVIGSSLNVTNTLAYYKCFKEHQKKVKEHMEKLAENKKVILRDKISRINYKHLTDSEKSINVF